MKYTSLFSMYGGKSKLSHLYPIPKCTTIVEPFAGGAAYSLRYCNKQVILYEKDERVFSIWQFLLDRDAEYHVRLMPDVLPAGYKISELSEHFPYGAICLMRAEANHGTMAARGIHNQVTKVGSVCWSRVKPRVLYWLPRIKHWQVYHGDYTAAPNMEATWFIDPPYQKFGNRYLHSAIDYDYLSAWCKLRRGQIIVCESQEAEWLKFEPLARRRGFRSKYQKSDSTEAMYQIIN